MLDVLDSLMKVATLLLTCLIHQSDLASVPEHKITLTITFCTVRTVLY